MGGSRPLIVGIGGTSRQSSTSERALRIALAEAEAAGAEVELVVGNELLLPIYDPATVERTDATRRMIDLIRRSNGLIIASPGYHGSISGMLKNALDYTEDLRDQPQPYFDGRAVGCIACAAGWQATGATLATMRSIVHALRGWPTPLGVTLNSAMPIFGETGECLDLPVRQQLRMVAHQVVEFANMRRQLLQAAAA